MSIEQEPETINHEIPTASDVEVFDNYWVLDVDKNREIRGQYLSLLDRVGIYTALMPRHYIYRGNSGDHFYLGEAECHRFHVDEYLWHQSEEAKEVIDDLILNPSRHSQKRILLITAKGLLPTSALCWALDVIKNPKYELDGDYMSCYYAMSLLIGLPHQVFNRLIEHITEVSLDSLTYTERVNKGSTTVSSQRNRSKS